MQKIFQNRTKFLLWLLPLLFVVIYSCTKNDLASGKPENKQNFTEKFFSTKTIVNPQVAGIIELLKKENKRSGFVDKLPSYYGLPIWEKAGYVSNNNSSNSFGGVITSGNDIYIPMTVGYYGLSAVMVAKWETADSFNIRFYSKDYLYNVCHADALDTAKAENLLTLFFVMENYCFGTTAFYHIPAKLFQKSTEIDEHGDKIIRIKDNSNNQSTNSLIYCVTFYHCINSSPCNGWYCDRCPLCETTICHYEEDPPPGGGGGGGGDGPGGGPGGGGGGPGGGGPPNCGQVFYLVNPCDPPPVPDTLTPQQILQLLHDENEAIKLKRDSVWTVALDSNQEYHFFVKKNVSTFQVLGIATDHDPEGVTPNRIVEAMNDPDGDYHTHQDANSPQRHLHDPQDISVSNIRHRKLYYRSYVDCGDTLYVVVNENLNKIKQFLTTHSLKTLQNSTEWQNLASAGNNRRSLGITLLINLLGNSSITGLGLYKSTNSAKTEFIKVN